jgi:hypothetical protein
MSSALFNGYLERLKAEGLPGSIKPEEVNGESIFEPLLQIGGDGVNLSLQLDRDMHRISHSPGCCFSLIVILTDLNLQSLVGCHVHQPVSLVFGVRFH